MNPRKRASDNDETLTPKRKKHGRKHLNINITELLEEAMTWDEQENVNWTQLATKYGLTAAEGKK